MLITGGVGVFASNFVFQKLLDANVKAGGGHDWSVPFLVALASAAVLTVLMAICFNPKGKAKAQ